MSWYTEVPVQEEVSQGDIFLNIPLYSVDVPFDFTGEAQENLPVTRSWVNVIILTQACDLVSDPEKGREPVTNVVAAYMYDAARMEVKLGKGDSRWGFFKTVKGNLRPGYFLLGKYQGSADVRALNFQVVDFSSVVTIPYEYLMAFREYHGKRLRLNPPYNEALSNRFGNYFDRVGLPDDAIDGDDLKKNINPPEQQ